MKTSPPARRHPSKKNETREVVIAAFWDFSCNRALLKESERLLQIKEGISADLYHAIRVTFDLHQHSLAAILNSSVSTLERRRRERKALDSVASERVEPKYCPHEEFAAEFIIKLRHFADVAAIASEVGGHRGNNAGSRRAADPENEVVLFVLHRVSSKRWRQLSAKRNSLKKKLFNRHIKIPVRN